MNQEQIYTDFYNVEKARYTRCHYCRCKDVSHELRDRKAPLCCFYSYLLLILAGCILSEVFIRFFFTQYYDGNILFALHKAIIGMVFLSLSVILTWLQNKFEAIQVFGMVCKKCGKFSCIEKKPKELGLTLEACMMIPKLLDNDF